MSAADIRESVHDALECTLGIEVDTDDVSLEALDIEFEEFDEIKEVVEEDTGINLSSLHYKSGMTVADLIDAVQIEGDNEDGDFEDVE